MVRFGWLFGNDQPDLFSSPFDVFDARHHWSWHLRVPSTCCFDRMLLRCSCDGKFLQRGDIDLRGKGGHCGEGSQPQTSILYRWITRGGQSVN